MRISKGYFLQFLTVVYVIHLGLTLLFRLARKDNLVGYAFSDPMVYVPIERPLWVAIILIALSYLGFFHVISKAFYKIDFGNNFFGLIVSGLIPFLLYIFLPSIVRFKLQMPYIGFSFEGISLWVLVCILFITGCILIALLFSKYVGSIIQRLKLGLVMIISFAMLFFSGQNIAMLGYGLSMTNDTAFEITGCFNFAQIRPFAYVYHRLNYKPKNSDVVKYIYRDIDSGDTLKIGTYRNRFLFRDYYLTKNCRFRVLRGFGFLFNLPDDEKYMLKPQ
jgi:hypothetical protein